MYNSFAFICFYCADPFLKGLAPTSFASNHHHHIVSSFQERVALPSIVSVDSNYHHHIASSFQESHVTNSYVSDCFFSLTSHPK